MRMLGKAGIFFLAIIMLLGFTYTAFCGDLILNDLESRPANLSNLAGKPAILFFWTTWCPYCRAELKALNKLYPQMEKEGLVVFAVNVGEAGYKVERFLKDYALNIRVLLDKDGQAAENYEIRGVPTYVFLDNDGQVVSLEHRLPADYKSLLLK
ncbi:MAG: TlpA family protein disulfide reductase [Candidatus Omnitrophica bacterium]|nr:TlpA family protein disulfide reductase [Candidatus Omnitrophota bacterium]MBU1924212.1 TlpA family protein disulfide reductase [Candidatus Omnitrophota bacterium]